MGGIEPGHVEWAVINRMKAMLDEPPETKFNVTQTFAIFSAVLLWTKNRGWVPLEDSQLQSVAQVDVAAQAFRKKLAEEKITSSPWALSLSEPHQGGGQSVPLGGLINQDFAGMTVETFVKWLRDAIGHGDGRTITPMHKKTGPEGLTWLSGFRVQFNEHRHSPRILDLRLYEPDMRRIGSLLAHRFCAALAQSPGYYQEDVATQVLENAQGQAKIGGAVATGGPRLRDNWYVREIEDNLDLNQPGIYEWRIEGVGVYIGKALRLKDRLKAYPNNVRRMLQGLHWHGDPSRDYRPIHHALRDAHNGQVTVVVKVLEVCTPEARNEREQHWIRLRRLEAAAGGPQVLNAS